MSKYRLRPNKIQRAMLTEILDRCRELYNAGLQEKRDAYQKQGVNRSRNAQSSELTELKALRPEYMSIHAQVLQNVLGRLHLAFDGFFRRVKAGQSPGYPRFKSRDRYNSFTFPQVSKRRFLGGGGVVLEAGRLLVHGIPGLLKIVLHRPLKGTPKTATFKREGEHWYVFFSCDEVPTETRELTGQIVGIDAGLESFVALDDGTFVENPRLYRRAEPQMIKAQRKMVHRKKGSNRRRKARVLYSKHCRRAADARRDFHRKVSCDLVRRFDRIGVEDLNVESMIRQGKLSKSIHDAGWAQFFDILVSKAESAGVEVVKVKAAGTSQDCAWCGAVVKKALSVRIHDCPKCGFKTHRDTNSSLNVRFRAFGSRPGSGRRGDGRCSLQGGETLVVDPRSPRAS